MESLTFKLDDSFGELLFSIIKEKIYDFDLKNAISFLSNTLNGCDNETIKKIICCDNTMIIEDNQYIVPINIENKDKGYHIKIINNKINSIELEIKEYIDVLRWVKNEIVFNNGNFNLNLNYDHIIKLVKHNLCLAEIIDNYESDVLTICDILNNVLKYITTFPELILKIKNICLYFEYPFEFNYLNFSKLQFEFNSIMNKSFYLDEINNIHNVDTNIKNYIASMGDINDFHNSELNKSNIEDDYDAGWLSPDGDFYGLNGTVGNMLHINIAEKLFNCKLIPISEHENKDSYLENNGWIKITKNWILFNGCNNHILGLSNLNITSEQKLKLISLSKIHNGLVLGYNKIKINTSQLRSTDKLMLNKYFKL